MEAASKAGRPPNEPHPAGFTCDEVPSVGDLGRLGINQGTQQKRCLGLPRWAVKPRGCAGSLEGAQGAA